MSDVDFDALGIERERIKAEIKRLSAARRSIEAILKETIHHRGSCRGGGMTYTLVDVEKLTHDPRETVGMMINELGISAENAVGLVCSIDNKRLDHVLVERLPPFRLEQVRRTLRREATRTHTTRFHSTKEK